MVLTKDAYYFSHDTNARTDPKIMALMNEYGIEGYGRFWIVVEMLSEQKDYELPHKTWVTNALAMAMLCDVNEAETFMQKCINDYELFESDGEGFWSDSLKRRMAIKDNKRQKKSDAGKKGAEARWGKRKKEPKKGINEANNSSANGIAMAVPCDTNAKNGKVKERKGKERKDQDHLTLDGEQAFAINQRSAQEQPHGSIAGTLSVDPEAIKTIQTAYEKYLPSRLNIKHIEELVETYHQENEMAPGVIVEALRETMLRAQRPGIRYAITVLDSWANRNVKTLKDLEGLRREYEQQGNGRSREDRKALRDKLLKGAGES